MIGDVVGLEESLFCAPCVGIPTKKRVNYFAAALRVELDSLNVPLMADPLICAAPCISRSGMRGGIHCSAEKERSAGQEFNQ